MSQSDAADTGRAIEPRDFGRLIARMKKAAQEDLAAAARGRAEAQARLAATSEEAERIAHRFSPETALLDRYYAAWQSYGEESDNGASTADAPASTEDAQALWVSASGRCDARLDRFRRLRDDYEAKRTQWFGRKPPEPHLSSDFKRDCDSMRMVVQVLPSLQHLEIDAANARARAQVNADSEQDRVDRDERMDQIVRQTRADIEMGLALVGDAALAWEQWPWSDFAPPDAVERLLRLGAFDPSVPGGLLPEAPVIIDFPSARSLAIESDTGSRTQAVELARSVLLRVIAGVPSGQVHTTLIDPVALGRSVADFLQLSDYDERLIDTKPWTSAGDIEVKLAEHAAHLELVISKYLRGQYQTIDEYNAHAGEMAEPYKLLVVFDFPTQITDRAAGQLLSIIENGPRCGVHTVLLFDPRQSPGGDLTYEQLLRSMNVVTWQGERARVRVNGESIDLDVITDVCPPIVYEDNGRPASSAASLLTRIGVETRRAEDTVVDYNHALPVLNRIIAGGLAPNAPAMRANAPPLSAEDSNSWWHADSSTGVAAPIGRSGAQGIASLYFSSTTIAGGALMVGLPRSGKTTSLHAAILSMCMLYGPEELELYLIDAKHGVEFRTYSALPHARMVAINSEREFAVAVLDSLDAEIGRRAEVMKRETPGRTNLEEYRRATGKTLPRIVVIIDEFQEIFEEDDRLGQAAFAAFSNIVRQGPFAGIHPVLASQTLSSMPAMDRNTLMLLPGRVAFMCNDADSQAVMGDSNPDVKYLDHPGEGLLNPSRGDPAYNERFQGIYVSPDDRERLVARLVEKAVQGGWARSPRVFDGDSLADRASVSIEQFSAQPDRQQRLQFLAGEPVGLEPSLFVQLRREQGSNLLFVGRGDDDDGLPEPAIIGCVHSLLFAATRQAERVDVVDFLNDEGTPATEQERGRLGLLELCEQVGLNTHRRHGLAQVLRTYAGLVAERTSLEDYRAPAHLLVLYGLQRAKDLDPEAYADDGESLTSVLESVLRDGPEVGVHAAVVVDSAASLQRRAGASTLENLGLRVLGALPTDSDRQQLLDAYQDLDLRRSQLIFFDRDRDRRTKFRAYGPITNEWLDLASLESRLHEPGEVEQ